MKLRWKPIEKYVDIYHHYILVKKLAYNIDIDRMDDYLNNFVTVMKCTSVNVFVPNFSITTVTAVSRRTSYRIFCVTGMMY